MGWAGGSELMNVIIVAVKDNVPAFPLRERIYAPIIAAFDNQDWDTQDECLGLDPAFDAAMLAAHPIMFAEAEGEEDEDDEDDLDDLDDEDEDEDDYDDAEDAA